MNVQQAAEAANITSYQMQSSFGAHKSEPGRLRLRDDVPPWVRAKLGTMGYKGVSVTGPVLEKELGIPEYARASFELSESIRKALGQAAVTLASGIGYVGA